MNKYNNILKVIDAYDFKNAKLTNDEKINAYDLYIGINNTFRDLKKALNTNSINDNIKKNLSHILEKKGKTIKVISNISIENLSSILDLSIILSDKNNSALIATAKIIKDFDDENIYLKDLMENDYCKQLINYIIRSNYYDIMDRFNSLDSFIKLFFDEDKTVTQEFSDGFIKTTMTSALDGSFNTALSIDPKYDSENVASRNYFNLTSINQILEERKFDLLKKMNFDISSLNPVYKEILISKHLIIDDNPVKIKN